jgi:hypothetical protein
MGRGLEGEEACANSLKSALLISPICAPQLLAFLRTLQLSDIAKSILNGRSTLLSPPHYEGGQARRSIEAAGRIRSSGQSALVDRRPRAEQATDRHLSVR